MYLKSRGGRGGNPMKGRKIFFCGVGVDPTPPMTTSTLSSSLGGAGVPGVSGNPSGLGPPVKMVFDTYFLGFPFDGAGNIGGLVLWRSITFEALWQH